jgi:pimeloyl-ACP methyl ester carboxylesterase
VRGGRWDANRQAELARVANQKNADAAGVYYSAGALDPQATRSALAQLQAPVLLVAGEYASLPKARRPTYPGLFPQAELAVQPAGGHFP